MTIYKFTEEELKKFVSKVRSEQQDDELVVEFLVDRYLKAILSIYKEILNKYPEEIEDEKDSSKNIKQAIL